MIPVLLTSPAALVATTAGTEQTSHPAEVGLAEVLRLLRERSPQTLAGQARIDEAAADVTAARVLPNPALDFGGSYLRGGTNTGSSSQNQYGLEVPLLLFGQRRERVRTAEAGVRVAEGAVRQDLQERERQARDLFVNLLARQEKVRLLGEASEDLRRVARVIDGRMAAGDKSRYDALRIQVEAQSNEADLAEARADADQVAGQLATLLGLPEWRPRAAGDLQPDPRVDADDDAALWDEAERGSPDIELARRTKAAAEESVALARHERLPVPVVSGGWAMTSNAESRSAVVGLSVPLPVLDRGQGAIARATTSQRAAERDLEAATARTRADLKRSIAGLKERREALETLEREVMGHLDEVRRMAEASYTEGETPILDLLDVLRSLTATKLAHLDAQEAAKLAENDLLFLTGRIENE